MQLIAKLLHIPYSPSASEESLHSLIIKLFALLAVLSIAAHRFSKKKLAQRKKAMYYGDM